MWRHAATTRKEARHMLSLAQQWHIEVLCRPAVSMLVELARRRRHQDALIHRASIFAMRQLLRHVSCSRMQQGSGSSSQDPLPRSLRVQEPTDHWAVTNRVVTALSYWAKERRRRRLQAHRGEDHYLRHWVHRWMCVTSSWQHQRVMRDKAEVFNREQRAKRGWERLRHRCR